MSIHVYLAQGWVLSIERGIVANKSTNVQGLGVEFPLTEISEKQDIQASTREEKMTFICQRLPSVDMYFCS